MPTYLCGITIDWGWRALGPTERVIARRYEARLASDPDAHTAQSLRELLEAASRELPGRVVRASMRADDGEHLVRAFAGRWTESQTFDPSGAFPDTLEADDYRSAGVERIWTKLYWPEVMLAEMIDHAAALDVSLSTLVERAWRLSTSGARDAARGARAEGPSRAQSVHLSIDVWNAIRRRAADEDRSMSAVVQDAVAETLGSITA